MLADLISDCQRSRRGLIINDSSGSVELILPILQEKEIGNGISVADMKLSIDSHIHDLSTDRHADIIDDSSEYLNEIRSLEGSDRRKRDAYMIIIHGRRGSGSLMLVMIGAISLVNDDELMEQMREDICHYIAYPNTIAVIKESGETSI